jgi:hypothetical protein
MPPIVNNHNAGRERRALLCYSGEQATAYRQFITPGNTP